MRYYISDYNGIPLSGQPNEGYTKLQAIARAQREIEVCVRLFGGKFSEYKEDFFIIDENHDTVTELSDAI